MTICLSTLSSGFPFLSIRRALVRWSLRMTASCRSLPIRRFFSLTSFSNGSARSNSFLVASRAALEAAEASSAACSCLRNSSSCFWEFSTSSRNSFLRARHHVSDIHWKAWFASFRNSPSWMSCNALCRPSTVKDWLSRSDEAFS